MGVKHSVLEQYYCPYIHQVCRRVLKHVKRTVSGLSLGTGLQSRCIDTPRVLAAILTNATTFRTSCLFSFKINFFKRKIPMKWEITPSGQELSPPAGVPIHRQTGEVGKTVNSLYHHTVFCLLW